jgi:hypothetical protein
MSLSEPEQGFEARDWGPRAGYRNNKFNASSVSLDDGFTTSASGIVIIKRGGEACAGSAICEACARQAKSTKLKNIYTNSMSHDPTTHTPKSHLHSFRILSIIGSSVAYNFSVIKSTKYRLFLLHDSYDLNTNRFSGATATNSLGGCILNNLFSFQRGLRESNSKVRTSRSKQSIKINKYLSCLAWITNNT